MLILLNGIAFIVIAVVCVLNLYGYYSGLLEGEGVSEEEVISLVKILSIFALLFLLNFIHLFTCR